MTERLRCPKCGNTGSLSLVEIHEESGATDFGEIGIDEHGALIPPTKFWFEPGDTLRILIDCGICSHQWKPRRQSISLGWTAEESAHAR